MMTRKDYIAIAKVINDAQHTPGALMPHDVKVADEMRAFIAHGLADFMEYDNPNFNRSKFIEACSKVEVKATSEPPAANVYIHTLDGGDTNG